MATVPVSALSKAIMQPLNAVVIYPVPAGKQWILMRNNTALGCYDEILTDSVRISPAGGLITAIVRLDGKYAVVVNNNIIGHPVDAVQEGTPQLCKINGGVIYMVSPLRSMPR